MPVRRAQKSSQWPLLAAPVQVGPSLEGSNGDAPRTIRFQNFNDGFVYGHSAAYVSHDGGGTWAKLDLHASSVYSIAVGSDRVWATTSPCEKGTSCQLEVRWSTDGGRSWSDPHLLPAGFSPLEPVAIRNGLIMSGVPNGDIVMTTDAGLTWRSIKSACTDNPFQGFTTTVDGIELWEACAGQLDANGSISSKSLFVSDDAGKTW